MVYPITIIGVAMLVIVFMLTFVIPTFAKMFKDLGAELPLPTQDRHLALGLRAQLHSAHHRWRHRRRHLTALRSYYRTEKGASTIDALLLKLPVFGTLIRKVAVARFTRTLGTLVPSGVPILEAPAHHRAHRRQQGRREGRHAVPRRGHRGQDAGRAAQDHRVFPPMVIQMISVGEQTGALDAMLSKIADFYDDEVDTAVGALTSLLEPIMIVFLGVIVGGLVVAMYLPIFKLVTLIK